jgi:hypothetical protein
MPTLIERHCRGKQSVVFPLREYWIDVGRLDDLRASDELQRIFGRGRPHLVQLMSLDGRVALVTGDRPYRQGDWPCASAELEIVVVDLSNPAPRRPRANWANAGGAAAEAAATSSSRRVRDLPRRVRNDSKDRYHRQLRAFVGTSGLEGWAVPFEQCPIRPGGGRWRSI